MDCKQWNALLDAHVAGELDPVAETEFTRHLAACHACRHQYIVRKDLSSLDEDAQVPELFAYSWRQNVKREEALMNQQTPAPVARRRNPGMLLRGLAIAAAFLLVVGGSLTVGRRLGQKEDTAGDANVMSYGAPGASTRQAARAVPESDQSYGGVMDMAAEAAPAPQARQEKIIRTVSMSLSTRTFDDDLERIQTNLTSLGGYVENSDLSADARARRTASLRLRVPVDKLDGFLNDLKGVGYLVSLSESAEDISEQYTDVETRLATQQAKMERLQALLKQAESVEDLLAIETEIANTQYQLDSMTGTLRGYDSRVNYATVWLTLTEETVQETQGQPTLGARIAAAVSDAWAYAKAFLADAAVFLIVLLPYALVLGVVVYLIIRIVKHRRKS